MTDGTVTNQLLEQRIERVLNEMVQLREDMRVVTAILQRMDLTIAGVNLTMQGLTDEVRAEHSRFDRLDRRLHKLEERE